MTNAEKLRRMTDDELLDQIHRLQDNAVACPTCFRNRGKMMLEHWLKSDDGVKDSSELAELERTIMTVVFNSNGHKDLDTATWEVLKTIPKVGIFDLMFGGRR